MLFQTCYVLQVAYNQRFTSCKRLCFTLDAEIDIMKLSRKGNMKTIKLSKIKNEFFRMGDERLWYKSGYDHNERAWRVCLVRDPMRYKYITSKTEVQL